MSNTGSRGRGEGGQAGPEDHHHRPTPGWALALSPNLLDGAIGRASVVVGVITIVWSLIDYAKEKR